MLKYSEIKPPHISMLLVALNAYGNTPFGGKLLKVLLERTAHLPIEDFDVSWLVWWCMFRGGGECVCLWVLKGTRSMRN